ncbi:MAG TPA: hypothetical protein VGF74_02020 [Thermoleophilaceae bacterium]|jgi:hypothetical protein
MTEYRQTTPPSDGGEAPPPPRWDEVDWDTWTPPTSGEGAPRLGSGMPDLRPLFALIDVVRSALPAELRDQFNSLVRELLLTLRALIDWYVERLGPGKPDARVEDIPIE